MEAIGINLAYATILYRNTHCKKMQVYSYKFSEFFRPAISGICADSEKKKPH